MPELSREELENRLYYLQREFQGLAPGPGRKRTEVEARLAMCKMSLQSLTRAELLTFLLTRLKYLTNHGLSYENITQRTITIDRGSIDDWIRRIKANLEGERWK